MKPVGKGRRVSRRDRGGQSEVVGLVTIFGIVFVSISIILLAGLPIINDATENTQIERFQTEFALLDQQIRESVYGPGQSSATVNSAGGKISVDNDSMTVNITHRQATGPAVSTGELPLGGIEYDAGGPRGVAYELGGVWANFRSGTVLEKPPDITYSGRSLEMNLMNFTSDKVSGGTSDESFYLSSKGAHRTDELRRITNSSLDLGELEVSVRSEFADGWAEYFENTMESDAVDIERRIDADGSGFVNVTFNTGTASPYAVEYLKQRYSPPPPSDITVYNSDIGDENINRTVSSAGPKRDLPISANDIDEARKEPSGEPEITTVYSGIESSGFVEVTDTGGADGDYSANGVNFQDVNFTASSGAIKVFYEPDTDATFDGDLNFDTSGGPVEFHIPKNLDFVADVTVEGDNPVVVYTGEDTQLDETGATVSTEDGRTDLFQIFTSTTSDINVEMEYNGTVYAPDATEINLNDAGAVVRGAFIGDPVKFGDPDADYYHDSALRREDLPEGLSVATPLRHFNAVERRVAVR